MDRLLNVVLGVLSTVLFAATAWFASWLNAFGPDLLASGPDLVAGPLVGRPVQVMLWAAALVVALCGFMRLMSKLFVSFDRVSAVERLRNVALGAAFVVAFFATGLAAWWLTSAVDAMAFEQRGRNTACTVLWVTERVETRTDAHGNTTTYTYYDHGLACAAVDVRAMTAESIAGVPGQSVAVRYDPRHRLEPRPVSDEVASARLLRDGALALATAAAMRGALELRRRRHRDPYFPSTEGLERVGVGVSLFVIAAVAGFLFSASYLATTALKDAVLSFTGVDQLLLGHRWFGWLVSLPFWLAWAVGFAALAGVAARVFIHLLAAYPRLDPYATVREVLAAASTGIGYKPGALSITIDSSVLRALLTGQARRRRDRR